MREELRALTANMRAGPVLADLMSMNPTDLLATRTAMRQQLDRELNRFAENDRGPTGIYTEAEVERYTSLLENRRAQLSQEYNDLQVADLTGFSPNEIADMDLSVLSELVEERLRYANQRMDAQIDADGLLDAQIDADGILDDPNLDADELYRLGDQQLELVDLRNELMRLQNERGDVDFAYTEDEMLNMSYNDLRETIDQYNQYPPEEDVLQQILDDFAPAPDNTNATLIDELPVDRTLAEYRDIAYTNNFVSEADRLQGFHAMVETSGFDETGEIRVDRTDALLNDGVWPEEFEELRNDAHRAQFEMLANDTSPDQKLNELFLDAPDRTTREWIVNNYNKIRTMLMNSQVPDDRGNIGDYGGYARGGAVTYDPDEIRRLSENLLAGNYYKGGPVTYDHNEIKKLSKQLMETYNV